MGTVEVEFPREVREKVDVGRGVRAGGGLKVVRLEGGRKVGEIVYRGRESLGEEIPRNLVPGGGLEMRLAGAKMDSMEDDR